MLSKWLMLTGKRVKSRVNGVMSSPTVSFCRNSIIVMSRVGILFDYVQMKTRVENWSLKAS